MFKKLTPTTPIKFKSVEWQNINGFSEEVVTLSDVAIVEWKNTFGSDIWQSQLLGAKETATIRGYFLPVKSSDKILKLDDNTEWEIMAPDNIENRSQFMEIKVSKIVGG